MLLSVTCAVAEAGALGRLIASSLTQKYRCFCLYLLAEIMQFGILAAWENGTRAYLIGYCATTMLLIFLRLAMVCEAWSLVNASRPRVERISRDVAVGLVFLAVSFSAVSGMDVALFGKTHLVYAALLIAIRHSALVLAIICASLALFASSSRTEYPVPPNTIRHCWLLSGYLISIAMGFFLMNILRISAETAGVLMVGSAAGFYAIWAASMTPTGELAAVTHSDEKLKWSEFLISRARRTVN